VISLSFWPVAINLMLSDYNDSFAECIDHCKWTLYCNHEFFERLKLPYNSQ